MTKPRPSYWFRSTGKSLIPADKDAEEALASVGVKQVVRVKITKPRRIKFHRWWFATINNYYENWPTTHDFQPSDEGHLRAWGLVKIGYRDVLGERLNSNEGDLIRMVEFVEKALARSRNKYSFVAIHNNSLVLLTPKSVAFDTLDEAAFKPIADAVLDVLAIESGIPVATMMETA